MVSLADAHTGMIVEVERISDQDKSFLRYISEVGLNPGVAVKVIEHNSVAESIELATSGSKSRSRSGLARRERS